MVNFPAIFGGTCTNSSIDNRREGSYVASYRPTRVEEDGRNSEMKSISAMPIYKDKCHEELRSHDYEFHKVAGSNFSSIENQKGNASTRPTSCFGPNNSGFGFIKSTPSIFGFQVQETTRFCGSTVFGTQCRSGNRVRGGGLVTSSTFTFPPTNTTPSFQRSSVSTSVFQVGFNIKSPPSISSAPPLPPSSSLDTSFFGPNYLSTSKFQFNSTSASGTNSTLCGIQGSQGAIKPQSTAIGHHQGSRIKPYSPTPMFENKSVPKIQSISGMPVYKNKSHEELRSEDYELLQRNNKCCQSFGFKTSDSPQNIFNKSSLTFPFEKSKDLVTPNYTTSPFSQSPKPFPSAAFPFQHFELNPFPAKSQDLVIPNTTISTSSAFSPSPKPFSESQAFMPTNKPNPFPLIPSISNAFTAPSLSTYSLSLLSSSTVSPSTQSTSVSALGPWPSAPNASQPAGQTSLCLTAMGTEVGYQSIGGQEYVPANTVGMPSSLVVTPFSTRSEIHRPNTSVRHGISSLPGSDNLSYKRNNLSSNKRTSLLRIRHMSSRQNSLLAQKLRCSSTEPKVPFFCDEVDRPRTVARNSLSLPSSSDRECCEDNEVSSPSFRLNVNPTGLAGDEEDLSALSDVPALMPMLPNGGAYYTEPSLKELAAKEMAEPGSCSRVNDFVVGRLGYGSIRFVGETDVRGLNLGTVVRFDNREVIVYADDMKKPPVGQGLNKPAEVTLLDVKCISKKTGKQYVDGPRVQSYKEMLINKASEEGVEFVSYDPIQGELKFRVQHF
ncbi:hypothetical protein OROGR_009537 [Orobanche gracilis]